jgi:hypothetical protein
MCGCVHVESVRPAKNWVQYASNGSAQLTSTAKESIVLRIARGKVGKHPLPSTEVKLANITSASTTVACNRRGS